MAAQEKSVPTLPVANSFSASNDSVVAVVGGNTVLLPIGGLFVPVSNVTPANSSALTISVPAQPWTDGNYLYVVTANNVVKRTPLSTF